MGYDDDFDSDDDELSTLLIMDEMDYEEASLDHHTSGGGCLTCFVLIMFIPASVLACIIRFWL